MIETIFCDLDGTLIAHQGNFMECINRDPILLPGVKDKLIEWSRNGNLIIITTGRPSTYREETLKQLKNLNIPFSQLVMDCGNGKRILINDKKTDNTLTAEAINIDRNGGF